jgi:methionine sulfoxide reductase catalytic subunit
MLIRIPPSWSMPEREATPETVFDSRRDFLRRLGVASIAAGVGAKLPAKKPSAAAKRPSRIPTADLYPAKRSEKYAALDVPLTPESVTSRHNIFDEFTMLRDQVWKVAEPFASRPWRIHVGGAVEKALQFDADELTRKLGIEERLYRFRCVEAWAMAVPWTGFPFRRFVELVKPTAAAKYVRMVTAARPDEMPGWYGSRRVFPYYEGLSLAEANNDLAFLATGIYGHPLPNQHGAPLRLVVPWKYGLKGIKSIVAFEFTREKPGTFWNELSPHNYSFESNVDPKAPGQSEETALDTGQTRPTRPYNGYGADVAHLYA